MPREREAPNLTDSTSHGRDVAQILLLTALAVAVLTTTLFLFTFPYCLLWVPSTWWESRLTEWKGRGRAPGAWLGFLLSVVGLMVAGSTPRRRGAEAVDDWGRGGRGPLETRVRAQEKRPAVLRLAVRTAKLRSLTATRTPSESSGRGDPSDSMTRGYGVGLAS